MFLHIILIVELLFMLIFTLTLIKLFESFIFTIYYALFLGQSKSKSKLFNGGMVLRELESSKCIIILRKSFILGIMKPEKKLLVS